MIHIGKSAVVAVCSLVLAGFAPTAQESKTVELGGLRAAVEAASKRGDNVDEVRTALAAFEKALPTIKRGEVPRELQALRDAVDAAARKGENVEAVAKELVAVEVAVAGRSLAKPKPEPRPEPGPNPFNPPNFRPAPFPNPFPNNFGGGIDPKVFDKAMQMRIEALQLMAKDPRDPDARKRLAEANEMLMKAMGGGANLFAFPDLDRIPDRARFGIRMERLTPIVVDQLGLERNVGIAVASVVAGSPAEKAGLKVHDIILEFAGKPVSDNPDDFTRQVNAVKAGAKIDLVILRKTKKLDVKGVELPER